MEDSPWPGSAGKAIMDIHACHEKWVELLKSMTEAEFEDTAKCRWPFTGRSFASLALWLNAELMKNAAEIGSGRFLYAVKK